MGKTIFRIWEMENAPSWRVRRYAKRVKAQNKQVQENINPQSKVLEMLLSGRELTVQIAFREAGTTELRSIVSRLRNMGYDITSYYKEGEKFKRYKLKTV